MNIRDRSLVSFVILAGIGLVGLFGQGAFLFNSLVHSYPFKMMDTPPAEFYASIGRWGYYIAIAVGVLGAAFSLRLARWLTAVVPVILGPLSYWLTFEIAHLARGFSREEMMQSNFSDYTGDTARYEFAFEALSLMFIGTVIAMAAGFVITKIVPDKPDRLA